MIVVGAFALATAVAASVLALRRTSDVERWIRRVAGRPPVPGATRRTLPDALVARVACGLGAALAGAALAAVGPFGPAPIVVGAYAGWIAPSVVAERRAARDGRAAERGVLTLVEWTHALVSCGRPPETAIVELATRAAVAGPLAASLDRVRRDYVLGVPMRDALAREGASSGVAGLAELAVRLERARDLGRGGLPLLEDLRDELRARERARALAAAGSVEGKLTAVMTLCYLPALALLVIVPLFQTLLTGLFGP